MQDQVLLLIYEKILIEQHLMVVYQKLSNLLIIYEVQFDVNLCVELLLFDMMLESKNLLNC
jgi:hypothetical protein